MYSARFLFFQNYLFHEFLLFHHSHPLEEIKIYFVGMEEAINIFYSFKSSMLFLLVARLGLPKNNLTAAWLPKTNEAIYEISVRYEINIF